MRRLPRAVTAALALAPALALALAGCAEPADGGNAEQPTMPVPADDPAAGGIHQADNDLQLEFDPGNGTEPSTWTLTCVGLVEGSHPDAEAACEHLGTLEGPFEPIPDDVSCTQQFGGPETAHVVGRWDGEPVDLELSRVDGCHISQWDALVPVVPAAA